MARTVKVKLGKVTAALAGVALLTQSYRLLVADDGIYGPRGLVISFH